MKCVNINHPDYITLKKATNLPESVLKSRIALWQINYNTEKFPSVEELNLKKVTGFDNSRLGIQDDNKQSQEYWAKIRKAKEAKKKKLAEKNKAQDQNKGENIKQFEKVANTRDTKIQDIADNLDQYIDTANYMNQEERVTFAELIYDGYIEIKCSL